MFFKNPFKRPYFTKEFYIVLIIAVLILLFAAILLRSSYAIKTQEIELREEGGSYDGKVKITREPDNTIVIETDSATVKIKDGTIYLEGSIIMDGADIGITINPDLLQLLAGQLTVTEHLHVYKNIYSGKIGIDGFIIVKNTSDVSTIYLQGSTGTGTFEGGLNVGSASGASAGQVRASGDLIIDLTDLFVDVSANKVGIGIATPQRSLHIHNPTFPYVHCTGTNSGSGPTDGVTFGLDDYNQRAIFRLREAWPFEIWTSNLQRMFIDSAGKVGIGAMPSSGALLDVFGSGYFAGDVVSNFDVIADDELKGKTLQLQTQTAAPPTASEAYVGQFYLKRDSLGVADDILYVCLRQLDSLAFVWVIVARGGG